MANNQNEERSNQPSKAGVEAGPPSISLPKGGGAIAGLGEKFSVNPSNGTASFSVPIFTTPSRSDFYPKLTLSYDSGSGNGPFGLGWHLSVPSIMRKTEKGLPRYRDAESSDVFILSEAEDLVPLLVKSGSSWLRDVRTEIDGGVAFTVERYRPRIEGLFARIERWQNRASGETYWKSISKDNVASLYGKTAEARIADPADPSHVFEWLLEESWDDRRNDIRYEYKAENADNLDRSLSSEGNRLHLQTGFANKYLKKIHYGKKAPGEGGDFLFQIVFDYGEHDGSVPSVDEVQKWPCRQDAFSNLRSGFEVRTYRLCRRVLVFHQFPEELDISPYLVHSTDFSYQEKPIGTYLSFITQTGYIWDKTAKKYQTKSLPPLEFAYTEAVVDPTIHFVDPQSLEDMPSGLDEPRYQWVDLNRVGLSGILSEVDDVWRFKRNLGDGQFALPELVRVKPAFSEVESGRQSLVDLAAEGELFLVQFGGKQAGFYEQDEAGDWGSFTAFVSNPNIDWKDPNLRFIDLDGDGRSDILIIKDEVLRWYPSRAREGFGLPEEVRKPPDEDHGPALVFADSTQSVFLADMTGDGLTDLVRIRNGEVCYWPNLGYGRFGLKVTMDSAPLFDTPDLFDQRRVRLADIDGSGTTDIIYLSRDSIRFWFNQAGNSWSQPHELPPFSESERLTNVSVLDLLGNGTACLVWSSELPGAMDRSMRYIDLMGGNKPHLLQSIKNNLGSETRIAYAASTKFYLQDSAAGAPWVTKLPFPVYVVERTETRDDITGNKFVTIYAYHHGYYDHPEREFRGFGLVEQWDTESYAQYIGAGLFSSEPNSVEQELFVPPAHTKTWFHTGAYIDRNNISRHFAHEYFSGDAQAVPLPDTDLPDGLTADEEEEACRALKGRMLRQEIYADDGSSLAASPYSVSEKNYQIRLLQPRQTNKYASFLTSECETLDYHYERDSSDPRISHQFILEIDAFGNVTKAASIGYPRRIPAYAEQGRALITYSESDFVNRDDSRGFYRIGVPYDARTYEITGTKPGNGPVFGLQEFLAAAKAAMEIPYESKPNVGPIEKRLIERQRVLYYKDDLSASLVLGEVESRALPFETYHAAFTLGLITQVFGTRVDANLLSTEAKYIFEDGLWWAASGRQIFDAGQFYLPIAFADPFGNVTNIGYDKYSLAVLKTADPLNNVVLARTNYRVLQPWHITDANQNRTAIRMDALGMVIATAVMGKQGQNEGDTLDETTPEASASDDPTTNLEYDLFNWIKNERPNFVHTLAREQHGAINPRWQESYSYSDGFGREVMKKIQAETGPAPARDENGILKRDGSGKLVLEFTNSRWVGTGRTVFNNKGKPVKKYEPFFSSTSDYEDEKDLAEWGVTPVLHYDPLERVIRTDLPDGTFSKVEFDPWRQATWDQNDTVLESQWYAQRESPVPTEPEPSDPEKRAAWLAAKHAKTPALAHLDTLGRTFLTIADNGLATDGTPQTYPTRVELDIEGNQRSVTDALGRKVMVYDYDMLGKRLHQSSMEAGERWMVDDVAGKGIRAWDSRGHNFRTAYDALRRPTDLFVRGTDPNKSDPRTLNGDVLFDKTVYGEGQPNDQTLNLRTRIFKHYDTAGVVISMGHNGTTNQDEAYDFKGKLLHSTRQLLEDFKSLPDWSGAVPSLRQEVFATSAQYDALNRVVASTTPDASVFWPAYNEANLLERIDVSLHGAQAPTRFVANIDYNARGQRELIEYGNGAKTDYTYDPKTFRLTDLVTHRNPANFPNDCPQPPSPPCGVQNLHYVYDPVGNITSIRDDAQQTVFFNNAKVEPSASYTYDAIYRLIAAAGREHQGQLVQPQTTWDDTPRINQPLPTDGQAMRNYSESYAYDPVGNFVQVVRQAVNGNWTRTYTYNEPSLIEPGQQRSNRLTSSAVGSSTDMYQYDAHGNVAKMPHLTLTQWDHRNQLQATSKQAVNSGTPETTYYVYDFSGLRVRKATESAGGILLKERIYLAGFEIYREYEADGTTASLERQTLHVMDDKRRVALVETKTVDADAPPFTPTPLARYQLDNHLGSAVLELDDVGAIISYEEYYPYGGTSYQAGRSMTDVSLKRYRYTGKERDEETGFYYHGARYYTPWLGRWTSADPAGIVDGLNLYVAFKDNPPIMVDRGGYSSEEVPKQITRFVETAQKLYRYHIGRLEKRNLNPSQLGTQAAKEVQKKIERVLGEGVVEQSFSGVESGHTIDVSVARLRFAFDFKLRLSSKRPLQTKVFIDKAAKSEIVFGFVTREGYDIANLGGAFSREELSEVSRAAKNLSRLLPRQGGFITVNTGFVDFLAGAGQTVKNLTSRVTSTHVNWATVGEATARTARLAGYAFTVLGAYHEGKESYHSVQTTRFGEPWTSFRKDTLATGTFQGAVLAGLVDDLFLAFEERNTGGSVTAANWEQHGSGPIQSSFGNSFRAYSTWVNQKLGF